MTIDASSACAANPAGRTGTDARLGPPSSLEGRLRLVALGVLVAAPAFIAYADFILNHFYRYGAVMLDSGLLADLAWHKPASLPAPPIYAGASFYAYHIAPIFAVLSALSWLTPLSMAQWFAVFTGTAQALLAVAVYWWLTAEYGLRSGWRLAAAVLLSVVFSFSGLAIAQVRYPHFEVLIAASLMLFLVAWQRRQFVLATVFFALCLICREDAGFHIVAVLGVLVAMNWRNGAPLSAQKSALGFMTLGFAYSLGALLLGRLLWPQQSSFVRIYLGSPPFAHLSGLVIQTRLVGLVVARSYIVLPAVCAAIWAIATRNPYLLVGYLAFVPWTVLNLLAKSDLAGMLSSYYAFPFLVAAFWPLIGWRINPGRLTSSPTEPLVGFGAMIIASFAGLSLQHDPSGIPLWVGFTHLPAVAEEARVERAMDAIHADHAALRRMLASEGVASLRPDDFRRDETLTDAPPGTRDTLIYFPGDRNSAALVALAAASGLRHDYTISGTPLHIATNLSPAGLPALRPLLRPSGA